MKYAAPVRREIGIRSIFNILGPLANPANASMQLLGVYDPALVEPLAQVLANLGVKRGMVVCGGDGLDEATITGPTHVCEIRFGQLTAYEIAPEQFGLKRCELKDLLGGSPEAAFHAAAMALKNVLGLTCDPVAGLVEIPCIKRNASGAMNALLSADLALAGVKSYIPFDEVVDAMYAIGKAMPQSVKETARGGLAVTPTGMRMREGNNKGEEK